MHIKAVYEQGILRPVNPLYLLEGEQVELTLVSLPEVESQRLSQAEQNAWELESINRNADRLNEEAMDVLKYQIEL
ncbi:MAG TPA: antitoxin family protein [Blastocatellia bacterium]|nr:antitoxin family protein [Blastocatellia bacterium]HMV83327.1 antitoxin family protein [Blastocatellia bacterium]HMX29580.1 antitoxin family protein [Blastocatellia bacterium]HMY72369.1 antitoxin family protein [Blastocatellia bacterium]HMZ16608.1 antitoxin family protein [Blastocatellia bacterium]